MAVELEEKVMREIGLGQHYSWFNGSGSCSYIARDAVDNIERVAKTNGLDVSPAWIKHLRKALTVDMFDGAQYTLTNTWVCCSYAIQDAIYRNECGEGFEPSKDYRWHFFDSNKRREWERMQEISRHPFRRGVSYNDLHGTDDDDREPLDIGDDYEEQMVRY